MVAAGFQSLTYQISVSTKMTLDAQFMNDQIRRKYLARKAMLNNIVVVCAPAIGGLIVGFWGYSAALFALSLPSAGLVLILMAAEKPTSKKDANSSQMHGLRASFRSFTAAKQVVGIVGVYCLVAVLLEIQAPLIFPFVHEVYSAGSTLAGLLLGLCGLGGLIGAYAAERWPRFFSPATIPVLVCVDGLLFFCFTQIVDLTVASVLFAALGAMGSITLILVESAIQTDVKSENRPFVFSIMQFAAGAGGATVAVLAAFLAEKTSTKLVLSGAAVVEVVVGVVCLLLLRNILKMSSSHENCD